MSKLTLHEAMEHAILLGTLVSATQIAETIKRERSYVRKDGLPPPREQIRARARQYPNLFLIEGGHIGHVHH